MMANRLEQLALQRQQEEMFEASLEMESGWDNDVQPYYEGPLATDMTSSISFAETLTASEILRGIQEDEDVTWQESCSSEDMVQRAFSRLWKLMKSMGTCNTFFRWPKSILFQLIIVNKE